MNKNTSLLKVTAFLFYFAITLLLYSKVLPHFTENIPTLGIRYSAFYLVNKGSKNLIHLKNPFYFDSLFYPTGNPVIGGFFCPIVFSLLGFIFSPITVQNITIILSFTLSAFGMFLLTFYLTEKKTISIVAGIYYSFSPYHFANLDTYSIFTIEWFPFFILYLLKAIDDRKWKHILFASLFLFLTSITSWYYAVFSLLIIVVVFIFTVTDFRKTFPVFLKIGTITFILILPFFIHTLRYKTATHSGSPKYFISGSADLLSYFIPARNHPLLSSFLEGIYKKFTANLTLNSNYLSLSALLLLVVGLLQKPAKWKKVFLTIIALSFALSLGPYLQIGGLSKSSELKLPYFWLINIPPFSLTRATGRYAILVIIGTGILMSYGLKYLEEKKKILKYIFTPLLLFEILPSPLSPKSPEPVPPFYPELQKAGESFSILELPLIPNGYIINYYNAFHNKKVMGGAGDRGFYIFTKKIAKYPFLRQLRYIGVKEKLPHYYQDIIKFDLQKASATVAEIFKIKYIVVHKYDPNVLSYGHYLRKYAYMEDIIHILKNAGWRLSSEDEHLYVFTNPCTSSYPLLYIGEGWSDVQVYGKGEPVRWAKEKGSFGIYAPSQTKVTIGFFIKTSSASNVTFYLNGEKIAVHPVSGKMGKITLTLDLKKGKNKLFFRGKKNTWYGVKDITLVVFPQR